MDFEGKVVVVTGAGAGIGAAVADVFAECGARVVGLDCNPDTLRQTTERIMKNRGILHPICADVASEQSVAKAFHEIGTKYESVDVLVNNVGVEFYKDFVDVRVSDWEQQIAVNLRSVFLCCSHVVPAMMRARRGAIVNTASVQAFATTGQTAPYAASKAGVLGLTRDLARDLGPYNIRVNGICPGCIDTPMMERSLERNADARAARQKMEAAIPLRRLGKPREIANVVAFLASDLAGYVSGAAWLVDGGLLAQLPVT
ncbi:MAG TPA: SDR family NAD(P)-dependent oxidoreductase [Bryobacteraceae bacterium]|nr:SDR family NAD(P)-dependent oxidoreductase [Bryobacteraceae bacterium]